MKKLVLLIPFLAFIASCSSDTKKDIPVNSVEEVLINISPEKETFEINGAADTLIKGAKGTALFIPADVFQFADGTAPAGKVSIDLKECYSLSEMIAENLSTTSGDKLLQTGGMIKLTASADGKELVVKEGKALVISFPKNNNKDTMDLFYEVKDTAGNSTWVPDYEISNMPPIGTDTLAPMGDALEGADLTDLPEDVYDYKFWFSATNFFSTIKLKGSNRLMMDFINDALNASPDMARDFYKNRPYSCYNFSIDKTGKMKDFTYVDKCLWYPYLADSMMERSKKYKSLHVQKVLESVPPLDTESDKSIEIDYNTNDYLIAIQVTREINKKRFNEKYKDQFAEYKNKAVQKLDKGALEYYTFSVVKLGWINCDRFWDTQDEKINFVVNTPDIKNTKVMIVFSDINSIMNGYAEGGKMMFSNVPLNRKIKVIGISYANGKPTMTTLFTTIQKQNFELTGFKEFTLAELEQQLNKGS
ncbi:MAG: hypothetical protein AB7P01_00915 [Bacteroidia bacterium]